MNYCPSDHFSSMTSPPPSFSVPSFGPRYKISWSICFHVPSSDPKGSMRHQYWTLTKIPLSFSSWVHMLTLSPSHFSFFALFFTSSTESKPAGANSFMVPKSVISVLLRGRAE